MPTRTKGQRQFFGISTGGAGSDTVRGKKAIRWAEVTGDRHAGVRVAGAPYIRWEGGRLRVLSAVVGRSEKNRRPESPEYRLDTANSPVFEGGFTIALIWGGGK